MTYDAIAPMPAEDANKYSRGKLVLIAGSASYPGAAILAARASQRMGAGYTQVLTHKEVVAIVRMSSPSLVVQRLNGVESLVLPQAREGHPCAVCIGPGFEPDDESMRDMLVHVLKEARCPVLVDGGALAHLCSKKMRKRLAKRASQGLVTVLTPHGGEAARLAKALKEDEESPMQLAQALARAYHSIVVLKGPNTYISDGMQTSGMHEGTSALSKAGTGDVLAGMIAALLAQGIDPYDAARAGATLHARAGVAAAASLTEIAVTAEDVVEAIPQALRQ